MSAGALAQLKASLQVSLIHIWPDTLLNLDSALIDCLPLYDLECVYSLSALEPVKRLGANRVIWLPLAGDPRLHSPPEYAGTETAEKTKYGADVAFIGGWRPEREDALTALAESGRFNLKVWGPDWGQRCKSNPALMKVWQGRGLRGNEFAGAVAASKVNLNIIDQTNYPAANMRFFEIPCAGGLQISSRCPEMEGEFKHGEAIFYYRDAGELSDQILHLLGDIELCERVRQAGRGVLIGRHTYLHRAKQILALTINQDSTAHAGS